ncbi:tRNA (adenosine(37)-N6)-dimethylallyltransferase MiaA [Mycetocola reblochoni]|uniref:tRNA dimethylallyltransferase n=1 Tax=Mycetocola reblochoni REB411 TaxID=1255698 RepID=A0A1R4IEA6_9MICO|nr:tRNA (adenosine(37)-N6)-dimethylallyltransferase MiaA [Mycetocola reblochoni]SJN18192.1 tRNA dimethylallyltransferase [Mycetocola reblochoni REB411]
MYAVVGPTGTGKSDYAILLAQRLIDSGRVPVILNADAMQLYRGMDIGTAKLTEEERQGVRHELLDVLSVTDEASVAWYQDRARRIIQDALDSGRVPIMVGGSGLYLQAVLDDFRFPGTDPDVRGALEAELEEDGAGVLWRRLAELDSRAADRIGPFNGRRIVRALEVMAITGETFSAMLPEVPRPWWRATRIGFADDPAVLAARLDARVVRMWRTGLLDEVRGLLSAGLREGRTASRAIGYAQATAQLDGDVSADEAIAQTQALTRRYARRQRSWFRRDQRILWLSGADGAARTRIPDALLRASASDQRL